MGRWACRFFCLFLVGVVFFPFFLLRSPYRVCVLSFFFFIFVIFWVFILCYLISGW